MVVAIIREYRTWFDVLDSDSTELFAAMSGHEMKRVRCRILRLVSKYKTGHCFKGQVFIIPEFELDSAVKKLKKNKGFHGRLRQQRLSVADVNDLIKEASHGIINLELD